MMFDYLWILLWKKKEVVLFFQQLPFVNDSKNYPSQKGNRIYYFVEVAQKKERNKKSSGPV